MFDGIYKGKKVLITGAAGFKGSWLSLWLKRLGADVIGYGHNCRSKPNHFQLLNLAPEIDHLQYNLVDYNDLYDFILDRDPDLIIHMAAKAIVARTFQEPRETFLNNVIGTVNLFEAVRKCKSVKGVVCIVTDKVYSNQEWNWGYRENDSLGDTTPYGASKVCVEQVINCYRESYGLNIAAARAGNVIGGGDWSEKRLIPDIVRAAVKGETVSIHTPSATRPWQHVLEPLQGYLLLGKAILEGRNVNSAYNFGPTGEMTVLEVLETAKAVWPAIKWEVDNEPTHKAMVYLLKIDSTKARKELGWKPVWDMEQAVGQTILWYCGFYEDGTIFSNTDIDEYERDMTYA